MTACENCGTGSRGAFLVEEDGQTLCTDCAGPGECSRCSQETSEVTLSGDWLCERCQEKRGDQHETREAGQPGLGRWSE